MNKDNKINHSKENNIDRIEKINQNSVALTDDEVANVNGGNRIISAIIRDINATSPKS